MIKKKINELDAIRVDLIKKNIDALNFCICSVGEEISKEKKELLGELKNQKEQTIIGLKD